MNSAGALDSVIRDRLFVFDMDGTLLIKTTACLEIAKTIGTLDHLHALEEQFAGGAIDAPRFAREIASLWGAIDEKIIRRAFEDTPKLQNIKAVTEMIRSGGGKSCLITMSPDFYARLFFEYGFDFIEASRFSRSSTGQACPEKILSPESKTVIVNQLCCGLGFDMRKCVAFGDSMSDYVLFRELQHTVAVNADCKLKSLAQYHYEGVDLYEAVLAVCKELPRERSVTVVRGALP